MHDAPGHYVSITGDGPDGIVVEIGRSNAREPIRRERIELLSSIVGHYPDGSLASMPCVLELTPRALAFPINDLAKQLMRMGVGRQQITLLNRLHHRIVNLEHPSLEMFGDGSVAQYGHTKEAFNIKGGTWGILASGREIVRVYLTLDAARNAGNIVRYIIAIRAGKAQPVYAGE